MRRHYPRVARIAWKEPRHVRHHEMLRAIWKTQVPSSGQSSTVQGELLRAIAKLEDEATRNGNVNWDEGHVRLLSYVRQRLLAPDMFDHKRRSALGRDLDLVANEDQPVTDDDLWDRLHEAVGDWCAVHPEPLPRDVDPDLHR